MAWFSPNFHVIWTRRGFSLSFQSRHNFIAKLIDLTLVFQREIAQDLLHDGRWDSGRIEVKQEKKDLLSDHFLLLAIDDGGNNLKSLGFFPS